MTTVLRLAEPRGHWKVVLRPLPGFFVEGASCSLLVALFFVLSWWLRLTPAWVRRAKAGDL